MNYLPEVVVHAASLTDVDRCELKQEHGLENKCEGTKNIVAAANAANASLMHISTDYVFNGETGQYKETDSPNPINYYGVTSWKRGRSKINSEHLLHRPPKRNIRGNTRRRKSQLCPLALKQYQERRKVKALVDQWNSPTLKHQLSANDSRNSRKELTGIFHLSGATRISRYDFARQVAQKFNADSSLIVPTLAKDFLWVAPRPRDSSLDTSKAQRILKNKPLTIEYALQEMRQELDTLANRWQFQNIFST